MDRKAHENALFTVAKQERLLDDLREILTNHHLSTAVRVHKALERMDEDETFDSDAYDRLLDLLAKLKSDGRARYSIEKRSVWIVLHLKLFSFLPRAAPKAALFLMIFQW